MRRRNRSTMKKERIIMLASSVFVLTALTMTGFYVKEKNKAENDGYLIDMSALEKQSEEKTKEIAQSVEEAKPETNTDSLAKESDLDYDPNFQEANSDSVENLPDAIFPEETDSKEGSGQQNKETAKSTSTETESGEETAEPAKEASSASVQNALTFRERDSLSWPVAGNVLINYSMDKTVYFPTLQQYKYNPAILIAATEGQNIAAAADGKVTAVFEDAEIGHAVTMDIGNGYELTYGQLKDIIVLNGDVINEGDIIGTVGAPTKYYSVEGCNVYFKLTKDGVPVNPMSRLE